MSDRNASGERLLLALLILACPSAAWAQSASEPVSAPVIEAFDSASAVGRARSRQSRFERRRARLLPRTTADWSGRCDEVVGRFCEWWDEGEWVPTPESPEIDQERRSLVTYLDSVASVLPHDDWLLGQRVWYRVEGGAWLGAVEAARSCGGATPWWCAALEGLALHGAGDFEGSGAAFDRALGEMPAEQRERWTLPERPLRGKARDVLSEARTESPDSLGSALERFWLLSDPLYLVPGNDRRTAHFARWTVSTLREDARNPFGIAWGRDLEELTVRHGWELWWERSQSFDVSAGLNVIGHKHPEGREYLAAGETLLEPWSATEDDMVVRKRRPRSLYAPAYAPVFLPMNGQSVVFPRGDRVALVATVALPTDTTVHSRHSHPRPWLEPPPTAVGASDTVALFLISPAGGARVSTRRAATQGGLMVEAPAGRWIASAEAWSPGERRAGRRRWGVTADTLPPDLPALSGLLFVRADGPEPTTLSDMLSVALPEASIRLGDRMGVVWEVTGLGFAPSTLRYRLSVQRRDGNVARRLGRWLGLVGDAQALELSWEEAGPDAPTSVLRRVEVESGNLEPGDYDVTVEVGVPGRNPLTSVARLRVDLPPPLS